MYRGPNRMTLACDRCGAHFDDRPRGIGGIFEKARAAGWKITFEGDERTDLCPKCAEQEGDANG